MLHLLWWYCLDHAESGELNGLDRRDLAVELDWPEDKADILWDALTAEGSDGESGFVDKGGAVHAWDSYAGRLLRDRERKRAERAAWKDDKPVRGQSQDCPRNSTLDTTQPNPTNQTNGQGVEATGFDEFWKAYPRKDKKPDAVKAWKQATPKPEAIISILADLKRRASSEDWQKDGGRFIPLPASYLRGRRWEDQGVLLPRPVPVRDCATAAHLAARGAA